MLLIILYILRDIKNTTAGTLSQRITNQLLGLRGFRNQLAEMALYARRVVNKELPVNHAIIYHIQASMELIIWKTFHQLNRKALMKNFSVMT